MTLYDACSVFDMFGISMLEINDDDGLVATDIIHDIVYVEGASDSVDLPLYFDTMSGFVTRFDDVSNGNNDMSIFEYLPVSQHFPLITPSTQQHIYMMWMMWETQMTHSVASQSVILIQRTGKLHLLLVAQS